MITLACFVALVSSVSGLLAYQAWVASNAWFMMAGFAWAMLLMTGLLLLLTIGK